MLGDFAAPMLALDTHQHRSGCQLWVLAQSLSVLLCLIVGLPEQHRGGIALGDCACHMIADACTQQFVRCPACTGTSSLLPPHSLQQHRIPAQLAAAQDPHTALSQRATDAVTCSHARPVAQRQQLSPHHKQAWQGGQGAHLAPGTA